MILNMHQALTRLTIAQAAKASGYTEPQLRAAINRRENPLVVERTGGRLYVSEDELRRFVKVDQGFKSTRRAQPVEQFDGKDLPAV